MMIFRITINGYYVSVSVDHILMVFQWCFEYNVVKKQKEFQTVWKTDRGERKQEVERKKEQEKEKAEERSKKKNNQEKGETRKKMPCSDEAQIKRRKSKKR
jgi:uncharacterized membrane protein YhiD involved in acid resistance